MNEKRSVGLSMSNGSSGPDIMVINLSMCWHSCTLGESVMEVSERSDLMREDGF